MATTTTTTPSLRFDFGEQVIIVSGGTRGIGRAISEAFLASGGRVIATYHSNNEAATEWLGSLPAEQRERAQARQLDAADHHAVETAFREFEASGIVPSVLVNNAGIRRDQPLAMMSPEDWNTVIQANLTGTYTMSKFAVQAMMGKRYGRVVNITSVGAHVGFQGQSNYAATKAGQIALTRSLSKEVAKRRITVNCVSPGFVETELIADLDPEQQKEYKNMVPLRRFATPEEIATAVQFLASREAGYITGTVLEVSGGL